MDREDLGVLRAERRADPLDRLFDAMDLAARTQRQRRNVKRRPEQKVRVALAFKTVGVTFLFHVPYRIPFLLIFLY